MSELPDERALCHEAVRLYRAVFGTDPPQPVIERFTAARRQMLDIDDAEERRYRSAVQSDADLEALELAARRTGRLPLLSRCLRLVVYLAETLPENQDRFVSRRHRRVAAGWSLIRGGIRGALKWARGRALLRRLDGA